MDRLIEDLDFINKTLTNKLIKLKNSSIFITGGTGFFGKWLLEALTYLNNKEKLNIKITVLSRDPGKFLKDFPHLSVINFIKGDIESFIFPQDKFDYIIHSAANTDTGLNQANPSKVYNNMIEGTKRILDLAKTSSTKRVLYISSGAVYGHQPYDIDNISEDFVPILKDSDRIGYGEGKRASEELGNNFSLKSGIDFLSARCFAFAGGHLPLNQNYAVGNFISNGLMEQDIIIKGDGTPRRSYLYAADLVVWLITILLNGKTGESYNVGSDQPISIEELATKITKHFPKSNVQILKKSNDSDYERYVPSIEKCKNELGLKVYTSMEDAIKKMIQWHQKE